VINIPEGNIEIGISLILKENTAVPAVKALVETLNNLNKAYIELADPMKEFVKASTEGTTEQQKALQNLWGDINKVVEKEQELERVSKSVWVSGNEDIRKYVDALLKVREAGGNVEEQTTKLAEDLKLNAKQANIGVNIYGKYVTASNKLGVSASNLHGAFVKVTEAERVKIIQTQALKKQMDVLRYADILTGREVESLMKTFNLTSDQVYGFSKAMKEAEGAQTRQLIKTQQLKTANILLKDSTRLEGEALTFVADVYGVSEKAVESYQITLQEAQKIKLQEQVINAGVANTMFLLTNYTKIHDETTKQHINTLMGGTEQAEAYARVLQQLAENKKLNIMYNQLASNTMKPLEAITRRLGREFFWSGLGIMFTTMSIARVMNRQRQLHRESNQLAISRINLRRAEKDYRETLLEYGPASDEAREAGYQLRLMELRRTEQLEDLRASTQQYYLSVMMLAFGAFPSFIRTGAMLMDTYKNIKAEQLASILLNKEEAIAKTLSGQASITQGAKTMQLTLTKHMEAGATTQATGAKIVDTGATHVLTGAVTTATIATMALVFAKTLLIGLLTMGVGVVVSYAVSMAMANQAMSDFERQSEKLEKELYGSGLYTALMKSSEAAYSLGTNLKDIRSPGIRRIEMNTSLTPNIGREGAGTRQYNNINVSFPNLIIREEADINRIRKKLESAFIRGYSSRGGR